MRQQSIGASWYGQLTGLTVNTTPPGLQTRASSGTQSHGLRTCSITWPETTMSYVPSGALFAYRMSSRTSIHCRGQYPTGAHHARPLVTPDRGGPCDIRSYLSTVRGRIPIRPELQYPRAIGEEANEMLSKDQDTVRMHLAS